MTQTEGAAVGGSRLSREELQSIASKQKGVLVCILIYLLGLIGMLLLPPELRVMVRIVFLVIAIVATVYVFMLAIQLYGKAVGILFGILSLIPLVGLVVLLVVNGKATGTLRLSGIRVGLLGADLNQV